MALSLDDKLLGEKTQYYCSSSEDEGEDEDEGGDKDTNGGTVEKGTPSVPDPNIGNYPGYCTNTGPKGVLTDWREFKRLETEKREDKEKERQELAKKLSFTCRSHLNDDKAEQENSIPETFIAELEDEFLKEYRRKRIAEMKKCLQRVPTFGKLISVNSSTQYLEAIDKENAQVTIIMHIYEEDVPACTAMNGCLMCLAQEYSSVKFCKVKASTAKLSFKFSENGVPALLVYKNGLLIGNFIRLTDEFGEDFFATEIESFLQEHGFLPNNLKDLNAVIRDKTTGEFRNNLAEDEDSGSDFDID